MDPPQAHHEPAFRERLSALEQDLARLQEDLQVLNQESRSLWRYFWELHEHTAHLADELEHVKRQRWSEAAQRIGTLPS
jgi:predicted nuclease with TOPRIM domain